MQNLSKIIQRNHLNSTEISSSKAANVPSFQPSVKSSSTNQIDRARQLKLQAIDKQADTEDWIIPYILRKQSIVVLYAPAGSGKTFATWGLAKFSYVTKKVSEVFYFDGDNGLNVLFDRGVEELYKYSKFNYIAANNPRIHREFGEVDNFKLLRDIANSDENLSNTLFVFDSLKDFVGTLSVESGDDMLHFFRGCIMKLRLRGATIVLLHHTNKGIKKKDGTIDTNLLTFTGSQQILNSIETAYMVVPQNGETAQAEGCLIYDFVGEKRRVGGNDFKLVVHTSPTSEYKNLDIKLNVPGVKALIRSKKELKLIEKVEHLLSGGDLELDTIFKKLKRNRRDAFVYKIIQDYELIFWERYFLNRKKYLKLIKG